MSYSDRTRISTRFNFNQEDAQYPADPLRSTTVHCEETTLSPSESCNVVCVVEDAPSYSVRTHSIAQSGKRVLMLKHSTVEDILAFADVYRKLPTTEPVFTEGYGFFSRPVICGDLPC